MDRLFLFAGAVIGGLSVVLGAFGAHMLEQRIPPERLVTFETGVKYQMYHALALLAVGLLASRIPGDPGPMMRAAGWLFMAGIVLFSGSLYAIVFSGIRAFGAVAPIGGLAFIAGWTALAITVLRGSH